MESRSNSLLRSYLSLLLLLPVSDMHTKEKLEDMVREVNKTKVSEEDILSNCVYRYRLMEKRIE